MEGALSTSGAAKRIQPAELSGESEVVRYYPGGKTDGGVGFSDGQLLRVFEDNSTSWLAMFKGGWTDASGIFQRTGDPSRAFVVTSGAAYLIAYHNPQDWEELPLSPAVKAASYRTPADVVMMFDNIRAVGYGPGGRWATSRLFLDDLEVIAFDDETVALAGAVGYSGEKSKVTLRTIDGKVVDGQPIVGWN